MNDSTEHLGPPRAPERPGQTPPPLSPAPDDAAAQAGAAPSYALAEAEPFSGWELRRALLRPYLIIEYVLGGRQRLARNLADGRSVWLLAGLLLAAGVVATIPYGALSPVRSFWKIAVLYTGSLLLCFPCLHVFTQFFGFRSSLGRDLALSLVITSVAGLFTFGFFPIIWFIDYSTRADPNAAVSPADLSVFLLGVSLLMGIVHMGRCLVVRRLADREAWSLLLLILLWIPLLIFIHYRMACLLELL